MVELGEYTGTGGGGGEVGESHAHRRPRTAPRPSNPLRAARNPVRESPAALSTPCLFGRGGAKQSASRCAHQAEAQSSAEDPGQLQLVGSVR